MRRDEHLRGDKSKNGMHCQHTPIYFAKYLLANPDQRAQMSTLSLTFAPQTVLITGGTNGLGLEAARDIATKFPSATLILASRSGETAVQKLSQDLQNNNIHYMKLDLSSMKQVREFVEQVAGAGYPPITNLLLNAGLQVLGQQKSTDGIEMTFAVNHIGHFLLFQLLRPHLSPNARITVTASGVHDPAQKTMIPRTLFILLVSALY